MVETKPVILFRRQFVQKSTKMENDKYLSDNGMDEGPQQEPT